MYPQQPDPNQPPNTIPPQTPAPVAPAGQPATPTQALPSAPPTHQPWVGQPQMQPGQNFTPMHNYSPIQQPRGQAPAGWYTPPPSATANSTKPASVDEYLGKATGSTNTTNPIPTPSGQKIQGQYAVDYLGGIAPGGNKASTISLGGKRIDKKIFFVAIGGVVALLLAAVLLIFGGGPQTDNTLSASSLYTSIVDTSDITKTAGKNIKDSKLRATNASLHNLLTGSTKQMEEPLKKSGINATNLAVSAKKPPAKDEKVRARLEDNRLLGTYDRAYVSEMELKVGTMIIAMERIKKTSSQKTMQDFVDESIPKYKHIQKSLKNFGTSDQQ